MVDSMAPASFPLPLSQLVEAAEEVTPDTAMAEGGVEVKGGRTDGMVGVGFGRAGDEAGAQAGRTDSGFGGGQGQQGGQDPWKGDGADPWAWSLMGGGNGGGDKGGDGQQASSGKGQDSAYQQVLPGPVKALVS